MVVDVAVSALLFIVHHAAVKHLYIVTLLFALAALMTSGEPLVAVCLYLLFALLLDTVLEWRDHRLYRILAQARDTAHLIDAQTTLYTGHAFGALLSALAVLGHLVLVVVAFTVLLDPSIERNLYVWFVALLGTLRLLIDLVAECGRAYVIRNELEARYLDRAAGLEEGSFKIAPSHPQWGPLMPHRYFALEPQRSDLPSILI